MNKTSWLQEKKQFLSDYFSKKNDGIIKFKSQENLKEKENKIISKKDSWQTLLDCSRNLNTSLVLSSLDVNVSGFRADNPKAQDIIDAAFLKKINEVFDYAENNEDDLDLLKEKLLDYIIAQRLYKKRLEDLVKKLKNLDPIELLN
jgi:hypothetical protein